MFSIDSSYFISEVSSQLDTISPVLHCSSPTVPLSSAEPIRSASGQYNTHRNNRNTASLSSCFLLRSETAKGRCRTSLSGWSSNYSVCLQARPWWLLLEQISSVNYRMKAECNFFRYTTTRTKIIRRIRRGREKCRIRAKMLTAA